MTSQSPHNTIMAYHTLSDRICVDVFTTNHIPLPMLSYKIILKYLNHEVKSPPHQTTGYDYKIGVSKYHIRTDAIHKWVSVDTLLTNTQVSHDEGLKPQVSLQLNSLTQLTSGRLN